MPPSLTVNRQFMAEFVAADAPCLALGLIDVGGARCALIALRPPLAVPRAVSGRGFAFGHSLLGSSDWEVVHFAFRFHGFETYNVLVNPSDAVARTVLQTMVGTGDYFFFALDSDRSTTAFRSGIETGNLAGIKANMARLIGSTTTEAQYQTAVSQFEARPEPPGIQLTWVCRGNAGHLDPLHDPLVLNPAGEAGGPSLLQPMRGRHAKPPRQLFDVLYAKGVDRRRT